MTVICFGLVAGILAVIDTRLAGRASVL